MAKVHEYILVAADGTCGVTKSNGPICFQQSRQEVGGHFESFDPKLGDGYTAQINEDGAQRKFKPNAAFEEGVIGERPDRARSRNRDVGTDARASRKRDPAAELRSRGKVVIPSITVGVPCIAACGTRPKMERRQSWRG